MADRVLFCSCAYGDVIPEQTRQDVFCGLAGSGVDVVAVADLCGLAAERDPRLKELASAERLTVVACYPRAVRWLFELGGAALDGGRVAFMNMRTQRPEEILHGILGARAPKVLTAAGLPARGEAWIPWFPVIDYDRCKGCGQCLSFCLFGVYTRTEDGRVQVSVPRNCKTNCPACSRICPEVAIMFPKSGESPINGDGVLAGESGSGAVRVDLEKALDGDIYERLAERRERKRRLLKDEGVRRALAERSECERTG